MFSLRFHSLLRASLRTATLFSLGLLVLGSILESLLSFNLLAVVLQLFVLLLAHAVYLLIGHFCKLSKDFGRNRAGILHLTLLEGSLYLFFPEQI